MSPELTPIMQRLEKTVLPMMARHERIRHMVDNADTSMNWGDRITKNLKRFRENPKRTDFKEQFGDELTAFLFFKNRERYNPATYDLEKEKRQIKAVTAFLDGKHIHMGTREGKTSTVFPITSIVDALTSDIGSSVLVGSDEVLLGKLKKHTGYFTSALSEISPELQLAVENKKSEKERGGLDENSKSQMLKETLIDDGYSEQTRRTIRDNYWKESVESDRYEDPPYKRNTIYLGTDRDMVFGHGEDPEKFMAETGNIYFDEADVPYGRRSPYSTIDENQYYSPEEMTTSSVEWLRRFVVNRQLKPVNFVTEGGGYGLSSSAEKKLRKLKISEHVAHLTPDRRQDSDPVASAIYEGIDIISKKMDLDQPEKQKLFRRLSRSLVKEPEHADAYYVKIGDDLSRLHKKKGLMYTIENGLPSVRDSYIDQMLHDHKFSSNEQLNILALEGEFDFVPLNPVAFKTTTFQSFAKAMGKKLHCASGTLMFPDPETHKVTKTAFASFLKAATGNDIEVVSAPSIKTVPNPEISVTEAESIASLVKSIPNKPTLIVSYHLDNASEIHRQLAEKFGADKVAYVRSKPSDPAELELYEKETEKIYSDLAEGTLRAVVSSGAAGFGVDIIKKDGSFPDLHVALHGLPTNRAQLMQIYGRRGAPGDDFSWYVSQEFLEPYIMIFEERNGVLKNALGDWDRDEVRRQIAEAVNNPGNSQSLMLKILRTSEISQNQDDEMTVLTDQYIAKLEEAITRSIKNKIAGLPGIIEEAKDEESNVKKLSKKEIKAVSRENGLFAVISMNEEEFKEFRESLTDKEIQNLKEDLGKNAKQAATILKKLVPGLEEMTNEIEAYLVGISNSTNPDRVYERLAAIRSVIAENGWQGLPDVQDQQFFQALIGVPGGMNEFVMSLKALVPPEIQTQDPRAQLLQLNRYLLDNSIVSAYAESWYEYRCQELGGFRNTVKEGGSLYLHGKLDPSIRQIFIPMENDPEVKGVVWGRVTIWDGLAHQDFISYRKGVDTFILQNEDGDPMSYSTSDEFKNAINDIMSNKVYNLYGSGYSFLTN